MTDQIGNPINMFVVREPRRDGAPAKALRQRGVTFERYGHSGWYYSHAGCPACDPYQIHGSVKGLLMQGAWASRADAERACLIEWEAIEMEARCCALVAAAQESAKRYERQHDALLAEGCYAADHLDLAAALEKRIEVTDRNPTGFDLLRVVRELALRVEAKYGDAPS
jgi:hypothetical protein